MKKLNKILFACSILLLGFMTSCEQENIGAKIDLQTDSVTGLTFINKVLQKETVSANKPTFTVDLLRSDVSEPLTGSINLKATLPDKSELAGVTVTDFSFAEGEAKTSITVNVNPLAIGVVLQVELTIPANLASKSGVATTTIEVNKAYSWTSLGKGSYVDNWASGVAYSVEILKAEGFDRYRAVTPYAETMANDDGEWEDWRATSTTPYVEFWTTTDNLVSFERFFLGVNYQADSKQPIYVYHPSAFKDIGVTFNKWLDAKTVQLAPMYYVDGVGGWNNTQKDSVIIITLP